MPAQLVTQIQGVLHRHHAPAEVSAVGPRFFVSVTPEATVPKNLTTLPETRPRLVVKITNVVALSPEAQKEIRIVFEAYVNRRRKAQRADFGDFNNRPRIRLVFSRKRRNEFRIFDSSTIVKRLEGQFKRVFSFQRRGSF